MTKLTMGCANSLATTVAAASVLRTDVDAHEVALVDRSHVAADGRAIYVPLISMNVL
jgi:hypothetical protein